MTMWIAVPGGEPRKFASLEAAKNEGSERRCFRLQHKANAVADRIRRHMNVSAGWSGFRMGVIGIDIVPAENRQPDPTTVICVADCDGSLFSWVVIR